MQPQTQWVTRNLPADFLGSSSAAPHWSEVSEDDPSQDLSPAGRPRLRAIFISDLHIGTPGFQADALLDFLKSHDSETLYLVGDIVDGWQLRRRWFWPQSHNDVVQKLLRRARKDFWLACQRWDGSRASIMWR